MTQIRGSISISISCDVGWGDPARSSCYPILTHFVASQVQLATKQCKMLRFLVSAEDVLLVWFLLSCVVSYV